MLQQLLFDLAGVMPTDTQPLFDMASQVLLEAGEAYIRTGDTSRKLAFIEQGIIRSYIVKDNGDEATLFLRC